jgi:hypothetical protein
MRAEENESVHLSPGEFQSLRDIVLMGAMQPTIPPAHKARLLQAGYITEGLGGLMPTNAGRMRVAGAK